MLCVDVYYDKCPACGLAMRVRELRSEDGHYFEEESCHSDHGCGHFFVIEVDYYEREEECFA